MNMSKKQRKLNNKLILAAQQRPRIELFNHLLQKGADINCSDSYGVTPLMWAIRRRYWKIVKLVLKREFNPNLTDIHGNSLLTLSISMGTNTVNDYSTITKLLEHGADPNVSNKEGDTPLTLVSDRDDYFGYYTIKQLLKYGADPNVSNKKGDTPLEIASRLYNGFDSVLILLKGGAHIIYQWGYCTMLEMACIYGRIRTVKVLLEYGADKCHKSVDYALILSARYGHVEVAKELLKHEADPYNTNWTKKTFLQLFRPDIDIEELKEIVERNSNLHIKG